MDAYVVVYPAAVSLPGIKWEGLSLNRTKGLFGRTTTIASAAYALGVYDALTGHRLDYGTARPPDAGALYGGLTSEMCSAGIWADSPVRLADSQRRQIGDEFHFIVAETLPAALKSAGLIRDTSTIPVAGRQSAAELCHANY